VGDTGYAGTANRELCMELGIHTANMVRLAERLAKQEQAKTA